MYKNYRFQFNIYNFFFIKNILFLITSNNTFDQIKQNEEAQNWSVCRSWCTLTFHLTGKSSRHFSAT